MPNISYAGCPVYLEEFRRNSLLKCVSQPKIAKKFTKTPYFGVQGRSRSSMLVPPESSSAVLVMISRKSVSICNRFHARPANSGKITISRGYPSLMPSFEGSLLTQRHQITSLVTRDSVLSYGDNPESLSHLALNLYRVVTDGQTDGRTDGQNCHS